MNPALHTAMHSAANAQKQLLEKLHSLQAVNRNTAIARTHFGNEEKTLIDYYLKRGILKSAPNGDIYLDRRAYEDHQASMKTAGKWILTILSVSTLIGLAILIASKT